MAWCLVDSKKDQGTVTLSRHYPLAPNFSLPLVQDFIVITFLIKCDRYSRSCWTLDVRLLLVLGLLLVSGRQRDCRGLNLCLWKLCHEQALPVIKSTMADILEISVPEFEAKAGKEDSFFQDLHVVFKVVTRYATSQSPQAHHSFSSVNACLAKLRRILVAVGQLCFSARNMAALDHWDWAHLECWALSCIRAFLHCFSLLLLSKNDAVMQILEQCKQNSANHWNGSETKMWLRNAALCCYLDHA